MTSRSDPGALVEVAMLRLPVQIWARAQQHTDELLREFTLIAEQVRQQVSGPDRPLPVRLVELVDSLTAEYTDFSHEQETRLFAAAAAGETELDLVYHLPPGVGGAARHLGDLLNEADTYCREGEHLLTLGSPLELVRFREWFLDEFVNQPLGRPPLAWPDFGG
jgi:hypothetical protein